MEQSTWRDQISFIKNIEEHIGTDHLNDTNDRRLVADMSSGVINTCEEAAERYTQGSKEKIFVKIEGILNEYIKYLLDLDVHHNDAQRMTAAVGIGWEGIKKMLRLGYRKGAIKNATLLYKMAVACSAYDIAAGVAATLAHHYGQSVGDYSQRRIWWQKFELYTDQYQMVQEARNSVSILLEVIQRNEDAQQNLKEIEKILERLSLHKEDAESYMYWANYFHAHIYYYETIRDFKSLLNTAKSGYKYFKHLALNHSDAKSAMLSYIVFASNLMYQYGQAISYSDLVTKDGTPNNDLLCLRLACSFINLGKISRALELLDQIKTHPSVLSKVDLYRSYCLGECLTNGRHDTEQMKPAYLIMDLYCDIRSGKTDRYKHDFQINFVEQHHLKNTREGLIIEILSLQRYRNTDLEKFSKSHVLIKMLETAQLKSTEAEILRFEKMLEEIMT